jgi:hypothetical protein
MSTPYHWSTNLELSDEQPRLSVPTSAGMIVPEVAEETS